MARVICRLCGQRVTEGRSSHLKHVHGIAPYKGAVKEYFLTPEEADPPEGIELDRLPVCMLNEIEDAYDELLRQEDEIQSEDV